MAKIILAKMDIEGLLDLRAKVDELLRQHGRSLHKQLERIGDDGPGQQVKGRGRSTKGRKVAPKYRSKKNPKLTWAGRGAMPLWMRDEMKGTQLKKDSFLIK